MVHKKDTEHKHNEQKKVHKRVHMYNEVILNCDSF